jgi:hypothetical protein
MDKQIKDDEARAIVRDAARVMEILDLARNSRGDDLVMRAAMAIGAHDALRLKIRISTFLITPKGARHAD